MQRINLKFILDPKFDLSVAYQFYRQPIFGGVDFWQQRAVVLHKDLAELKKQFYPKQYLNDYVGHLYQEYVQDFRKRRREIEKLYQTKEGEFFKIVQKIFYQTAWPKGQYRAYLSVFDFGSRFLEERSFQVFMYQTDKQILFNIFHELMHFMFYYYALKKYPKIFNGKSTEDGIFWNLAELFNSVMHTTKDFIKLHGRLTDSVYPDQVKYFPQLKKFWQQTPDLNTWIIESYNILDFPAASRRELY